MGTLVALCRSIVAGCLLLGGCAKGPAPGTIGTGGSGGGGAAGVGGGGAGAGGGASPGGGGGGAGAGAVCSGGPLTDAGARAWVGTWACGPQLTETGNLPPAPGLAGNTLRQIIYTSIAGCYARLRLSNEFGDGPVTMNAVHVAVAAAGSGGVIDTATDRALSFAGSPSVTIPAGQRVLSDPFELALAPQSTLAVTIAFGAVPAGVTGHPGSRTTSYIQAGDAVGAASFAAPVMTDHWYYVTGLDVVVAEPGPEGSGSGAVVALGDSITDGRGSTTNANNRWPDALSRRLRAHGPTAGVAVLNQGIGGNAVVSGGLGPTAVQRFTRDVLDQTGVRWLIVLEGVNDIGGAASGAAAAASLIAAFGQFADLARARGIRVYGVPILPFGGNTTYASADHEAARQTVNDWIRAPGHFDAVIDLDAAVRDPARPTFLLPAYDSGDGLHLSPAGYQKMADAIDLALFTP